MTTLDTTSIAAAAMAQAGSAFSQQVAVIAVRSQLDAERAVADLVAQTASPPAPPGQGQVLDVRV
ncbi:hypothetical protein DK419_07770 [Methylobacterium terrae]|uniref:Motility protein n=1 Tax=Methylobacterium terrae TaxID=2202827 RepID=A0A2U8WX49_9HYPH|nr:putative motility protein [Methylobacterium terrae]AWN49926.1 hypothetical protein DK419_07770 [Methylobacterium terrae]